MIHLSYSYNNMLLFAQFFVPEIIGSEDNGRRMGKPRLSLHIPCRSEFVCFAEIVHCATFVYKFGSREVRVEEENTTRLTYNFCFKIRFKLIHIY